MLFPGAMVMIFRIPFGRPTSQHLQGAAIRNQGGQLSSQRGLFVAGELFAELSPLPGLGGLDKRLGFRYIQQGCGIECAARTGAVNGLVDSPEKIPCSAACSDIWLVSRRDVIRAILLRNVSTEYPHQKDMGNFIYFLLMFSRSVRDIPISGNKEFE